MRLGLFLNLSATKGRKLLRGIHAELEHWPGAEAELIPHHLRLWEGDQLSGFGAVLGEFDQMRQVEHFQDLAVPVINLSNALPTGRFPKSIMDEDRIGQTAAKHLLERGYQRFICLAAAGHHAAELRAAAFEAYLSTNGCPATRMNAWFKSDPEASAALLSAVKSENAPLGIFAWTDFAAYNAAMVIRASGKRVPDAVGIMGSGDDDVFTSIAPVPMSSIALSWESVGAAGVQMAREALAGGHPSDRICSRCDLVVRASTERYPVADPKVAQCLATIDRNLADPIDVPFLARKAGCSRRSLETRFRKTLKVSPAQYILEMRVKRASRLLRETELRVYEIATACGFEDANYFAAAFKRVTGESPSGYRDSARESAGR